MIAHLDERDGRRERHLYQPDENDEKLQNLLLLSQHSVLLSEIIEFIFDGCGKLANQVRCSAFGAFCDHTRSSENSLKKARPTEGIRR